MTCAPANTARPSRRRFGRFGASHLAAGMAAALIAGCVPPPPPLPDLQWQPPSTVVAELGEAEVAARKVRRAAREATVRLRVRGCDGLRIGSGFVIDGGLVITNRHVAAPSTSVALSTWDGRTLAATLVGVADAADIAVLKLDEESAVTMARFALSARTEPAVVGETVVAVGYPGGGPLTVSSGPVTTVDTREVFGVVQPVVMSATAAVQGNSGGPLIAADGTLVGVVFAADETGGSAVSVPVASLLELIGSGAVAPAEGCG
jgi:S1-C subfamily serine protease